MYLPERFQISDLERARRLMREHPLATVITVQNERPFVSHLPLVLEGSTLLGHLARANPHVKLLDGREVTAVFHGPNAYITPTWYAKENVPTWNYAVVHARGRARLIDDRPGIERALRALSDHVDKMWTYALPEDLRAPEKSIAAFAIEIGELRAKFKLSQHQDPEDRARVIERLKTERDDDASRAVARLMEE